MKLVIILNALLFVILNTGLPALLYLGGVIRETTHLLFLLAGTLVLSSFIMFLQLRRMNKNLAVFRSFISSGDLAKSRINLEEISYHQIFEIAQGVNTLLSALEQEKKEHSDSEKRYHDIVQSVTTGILEFNQEGDVLFCNKYAEKIFGYTAEELIGKRTIGKLNPEEDSTGLKHWDLLTKIFANPEAYAYNENENRTKDGRRIWVAWRNRIITDSQGKKKSILCLANDITEQKRNRELLHKSLEEKNNLLKEIHHRIKNNLQIIASILSLQKSYPIIDKDVLTECENRVIAMSMVHEQLFQSEDLSALDARWYITNLTDHIIDSYSRRDQKIETRLDIEPLQLDIDTAVPLGLIINELLTNSLRHGFQGETSGVLNLSLAAEEGFLHLSLQDNGQGLPKGFNLADTSSLGLKLVISLVEQLNGSLTYAAPSGVCWTIEFPFPFSQEKSRK
ncbi:MAG: PAS domain S-box protein [Spirochaetales bacterium]|nr:PAS domain S-box protein [Spirochaetales bacterium]